MNNKKHRPTSIDGVYRPRPVASHRADHKIASSEQLNRARRPQPHFSSRQEKRSMLNTTIPNSRYSEPVEPKAKKPKKHWSTKRKVVTSALAILLIGFGIGGWYGSKIIAEIDKTFHGNIFSDVSALFSQTTLKGENQGRVNILVAGDSADDPGHAGADLTDSIMVLSINTKTHTGFMLSIPRDLWVYIPGLQSYQKINAANTVTNFSGSGYPSGGMGQLEQVVQTDLGIPIDYYALVNYGAFRDAVNAVGGITINIQSPDPRGLYDAYTHLKLPNGEDSLNGQQALDLARARGDDIAGDVSYGFPSSDFNRTEHQRQMVVAIVKKATSAGVITNPARVSQLFSALGNNVKTDMNLQDALALAKITKGLNLSNLGSYTYSTSSTGTNKALLADYTDPASGAEALIPAAGLGDYGGLEEYYQQLTSSNPVVKEGASVAILNASDVYGLAKKEQSVLSSKGIDNVTIADANEEHPQTMIIDNSDDKDPETKQLLEKLFPGSVVTSDTGSSEAAEAQGYTTNFVVVLGQNWDNS